MRFRIHWLLAMVMVACVMIPQLSFAENPKAPPACIVPDVDKPHIPPDTGCWVGLPGWQNTCTQAASANVIYAECCMCCPNFTPDQIYQGIVALTGNVGQFPEEEIANMLAWKNANCNACTLHVNFAHKGYVGVNPVPPVMPQNVTFAWADHEISGGEHVKIWVVILPYLPDTTHRRPTGKQDGSHELTYIGRAGNLAQVHDSDCDRGGKDDNGYMIGVDVNGEYLTDYFGPGLHGYLKGVISVSSSPTTCEFGAPSLTELGMLILVILIIGSGVFIMLRRRKAALPA